MKLCVKDILRITNGELIFNSNVVSEEDIIQYEIKDIQFDSRKVTDNSLFVAIPGETVDPHKFIGNVAENTKAVIVEKDIEEILKLCGLNEVPHDVAIIKVNNSLDALQAIGAYYRDYYQGTVIGVTGSVGKTTTREMITETIRSNIDTFSTTGNMNSQIGVPVTISKIFDIPSKAAVIEMGISEPGGMDRLAKIVRPNIAVVTIIGQAHIEFLGSKEGIRKEKLRITSQMDESGVLFLNADDPLLFDIKDQTGVKTFTYGTNPEADYVAEDIVYGTDFNTYTFKHGDKKVNVKLSMLGKHNILNSLVAMAVCDYMGLNLEKAAKSLESFQGLRQKTVKSDKGFTIIDDSYNASPDSMKAALNVLRDYRTTGRKIAVLGDMFELGPDSPEFHKEVGEYAASLKSEDGKSVLDELITIGENSLEIHKAALLNTKIKVSHFTDKNEAASYLSDILKSGDVVTLKASNGMKFWEIVDKIR
ncbi:MAG: UDP-N-acetylmuramoyl-tripeptide--D-alanyl-D-alanine ligase [Eubacterium sp.]|nr:UDP-N-acetylmuramoyl-tripeptide--D-alanyl-D-alanine ligase [Eubacterium sp.]